MLACKGEVGIFDRMIHQDQKFSHDGGQSDFSGFTSQTQSLIKYFQGSIETAGADCGHVECPAQSRSSSPDGSATTPSAAFARVRRQASQSSHLSAIEMPQFGQFCQYRQGCERAHTTDGFQTLDSLIQCTEPLAHLFEEGLNLFQVGLQASDQSLGLTAQSGQAQALSLQFLSDQRVYQLSATADQLDQFLFLGAPGRGGCRMQALAIGGEDGRIDAIGFSQLAGGTGKMADTSRIEHADRNASGVQHTDQVAFIAASGFADDMHLVEAQQNEQALVADSGVGQVVESTGPVELEVCLGDIQASVDNSRGVRSHSCKYELACVGRSINGSSSGHMTRAALAPRALSQKLTPEGNEHIRADALPPAGGRAFPFSRLANAKQERWKIKIQEGEISLGTVYPG